MFKSTQRMKSGEFARTISRLGGRDNASTVHDTTTYFERVAKEHLRTLMQLEADRMVNLRLTEEEVRTEREVIKEERRSNVDADPVSVLSEQMLTVLYRSHPYRRPVLGFADEMSRLTRQDAIAFYRRFYAPNNAILVVAGDVTPEEVKTLAEATYGRNKANPAVVRAAREPEPAPTASRRVHLEDARAGTSMLLRNENTRPPAPGRLADDEIVDDVAARRFAAAFDMLEDLAAVPFIETDIDVGCHEDDTQATSKFYANTHGSLRELHHVELGVGEPWVQVDSGGELRPTATEA
jgi:zinc protease